MFAVTILIVLRCNILFRKRLVLLTIRCSPPLLLPAVPPLGIQLLVRLCVFNTRRPSPLLLSAVQQHFAFLVVPIFLVLVLLPFLLPLSVARLLANLLIVRLGVYNLNLLSPLLLPVLRPLVAFWILDLILVGVLLSPLVFPMVQLHVELRVLHFFSHCAILPLRPLPPLKTLVMVQIVNVLLIKLLFVSLAALCDLGLQSLPGILRTPVVLKNEI
mmetsp:Transcript_51635/g.148035  ORF Transcript_51635/g.148035 Transcript_51635/m.148035 type:complete len:216 (+) Transcript_51635:160-807(+)